MGMKVSKDLEALLLQEGKIGPTAKMPDASIPKAKGRTVRHEAGKMNNTEAAFSVELDTWVTIGTVFAYKVEPLKLRLADKTYYSPDFLVIMANGEVVFYEAKGFWEDDARVKIKVAVEQFPWFRFVAVTGKKKGGTWHWQEEHFK